MRRRYKHRCRWLYQPKKVARKYSPKKWPRAVLYCWQTGKRIRERECVPCLLARSITSITSHSGLPHKQPMTSAEWEKRHGTRKR